MIDILNYFSNQEYPGRNITIGRMDDDSIFFCYGIMGRSEHSKNRIFVKEDNIIKTKAYDESLLKDPSLIIYNAVIPLENGFIVTNGDQSDTIDTFIKNGDSFENALFTREYENDEPNYTPRISSLITFNDKGLEQIKLSILKRSMGSCRRYFFNYDQIEKNTALTITTYSENTNPLKSFMGEPIEMSIPQTNDIESLSNAIFDAQNENNKISLYGIKYNIGEEIQDIIININEDK